MLGVEFFIVMLGVIMLSTSLLLSCWVLLYCDNVFLLKSGFYASVHNMNIWIKIKINKKNWAVIIDKLKYIHLNIFSCSFYYFLLKNISFFSKIVLNLLKICIPRALTVFNALEICGSIWQRSQIRKRTRLSKPFLSRSNCSSPFENNQNNSGRNHRHLRNIDCLMVHVFFISTVNGCSKKRRKEAYYELR